MFSPNKLITTAVALTAVGGSVGGIYYYSLDKTIKDKLTRDKVEIISENAIEKIWKTAWNEISHDSALKNVETSVTSFDTLKSWCTNSYTSSLSEKDKLEKVKKLCIQPPKNIGEKLVRKGKRFTDNWGEKLTSLKGGSENNGLLDKLKTTTPSLNDLNTSDTANAALKKWCESRKNIDLPESGGITDYEEVIKYCVK